MAAEIDGADQSTEAPASTTSTGGATGGTVDSGNSNDADVFERWSETLYPPKPGSGDPEVDPEEPEIDSEVDHANKPFVRYYSTDERAQMTISLGLFPGPDDARRDGKSPLPERLDERTKVDLLRVDVAKGFLVILEDKSWKETCEEVVPDPGEVAKRYYTPDPKVPRYQNGEIQCLLTLDCIFLACFLMVVLDIYPWMLGAVENIFHSQARDIFQHLSLQILKAENQVPLKSIRLVYKLLVTKLLRTPECDEVTDYISSRICSKFVESNSIPSFPTPLFLGINVVRQMNVKMMSADIPNPRDPSKRRVYEYEPACEIECRNLLHCQMEALWSSAFPAKYVVLEQHQQTSGVRVNDKQTSGVRENGQQTSGVRENGENLIKSTLRKLMMILIRKNSSLPDIERPEQENGEPEDSDFSPAMVLMENSYPVDAEGVRKVKEKWDSVIGRRMATLCGKLPDVEGDPAPPGQPGKLPEKGYERLLDRLEIRRSDMLKKYKVETGPEKEHGVSEVMKKFKVKTGLEKEHGDLEVMKKDKVKTGLENEHGALVKPIVDEMKRIVAGSEKRSEEKGRSGIAGIGRRFVSIVSGKLLVEVVSFLAKKTKTDSPAESLETAQADPLSCALPTASELYKYGVSIQGQEGIFPRFERNRFRSWSGTLYLPEIKFLGKATGERWQSVLAYEDRWMHCTGIWDDIMWLYGKSEGKKRRPKRGNQSDQRDPSQNNEDQSFNPRRRRKPFLSYLQVMDELVNTEADVNVLVTGARPVILATNLGDQAQVADFFNSAADKYANSSVDDLEWVQLKTVVRNFHTNKTRRVWVQFLNENLSKPWVLVPLLAGFVVSVASAIQAYYSVKNKDD